MADENLRPLIEDVNRKVDLLVETLSPVPARAERIEETLDEVKEDVAVIREVVKDHSPRLTAVEGRVDHLEETA